MLGPCICRIRGCKHFIGVIQPDETEKTETFNCEAFPNGIPDDIINGKSLHLTPVEGDNGIVFEATTRRS